MARNATIFFLLLLLIGWFGQTIPADAISSGCANFSTLTGNYGQAISIMSTGRFARGDVVTVSITPINETTGTWRLVGNNSGRITLSGPASLPATLTYRVGQRLPRGSKGIGFYFDELTGVQLYNVVATCTNEITGESSIITLTPTPYNEFQLRTITCDTEVFDRPSGSPIGSNRVLTGQTWRVRPTPVIAADGVAWAQIDVGGTAYGWIPARCVQ